MKGKQLTVEEVEKLPVGSKIYLSDLIFEKVKEDTLISISKNQTFTTDYLRFNNIAFYEWVPDKYEAKQVYTTPEAIQMLYIDKSLRFESKTGKILFSYQGFIKVTLYGEPSFVSLTEPWALLGEPKPVDFMTALKSGKRIKPMSKDKYARIDEVMEFLSHQNMAAFQSYIDGKWEIDRS